MFKYPVDISSSISYFFQGNLQNQWLWILLRKRNEFFKKRKYVFTRVIIKIKVFHSCHNRVVRLATCRPRKTLVSLVSYSFHTRVALVSGTRVVKWTRSARYYKVWQNLLQSVPWYTIKWDKRLLQSTTVQHSCSVG